MTASLVLLVSCEKIKDVIDPARLKKNGNFSGNSVSVA
jgi:hypothetical protein